MDLRIVEKGNISSAISSCYIPIVTKILKYGINYPDYLTEREVEMVDGSTLFFDRLVKKVEENKSITKN